MGCPTTGKVRAGVTLWGAILSLAVCAMLCGARSLYAITQWGRDHGAVTGNCWGSARGRRPVLPPSTGCSVFKELDVDAYEAVLGEWLTQHRAGAWGDAVPGRQDPRIKYGAVSAGDSRGRDIRGASGVGLCYPERDGAGPEGFAREGSRVGGGQSSAGSGPSGGPDSGGGRPVDATGSVPADCVWWRGLPVAGERESAHVVPVSVYQDLMEAFSPTGS